MRGGKAGVCCQDGRAGAFLLSLLSLQFASLFAFELTKLLARLAQARQAQCQGIVFITGFPRFFIGNKPVLMPSAGTNDLFALIPLVVSSPDQFKNKVPSFLVTFLYFLCCRTPYMIFFPKSH